MTRFLVAMVIALGVFVACSKTEADGPVGPAPTTTIQIRVEPQGYQPATVHARAGELVRLVFTRTSDVGCGQRVKFPALNIQRDLPLNVPVAIDVRMPASGRLAFTCGMDMMRGEIVVR